MNETAKWGLITTALLIFFLFLIPVNIYSSGLYLIVMVGAVALTFVLVKLLVSIFLKKLTAIMKNPDLMPSEKSEAARGVYNPSGCVVVPVIVVLFFSMVCLLIWREVQMEKNELENHGQLTLATVVNGDSFSSRRFDFSNLVLGFKKADGDSAFVKHGITAKQFEQFYKNETVPVIYSTRYPSILKIVDRQEEVDRYLKKLPVKKEL